MKRILKTAIIMSILIALIVITTSVSAYTASASLKTSSTLIEGDFVTVTLNLSNLDLGEGIDALVATLDYDETIFETVVQDNIAGVNSWVVNGYSTSSKKFTATRSSKFTTAGDIVTIKLKVKSAITAKSAKVSLNNIQVSGGAVSDGGTGDVNLNNASVIINANSESTTDNTVVNNTTTNTTTNKNTTLKDNTVTSKTTLPKTGIGQYGIVAIVIVAIAGIFSYVLYKKTSKEVK